MVSYVLFEHNWTHWQQFPDSALHSIQCTYLNSDTWHCTLCSTCDISRLCKAEITFLLSVLVPSEKQSLNTRIFDFFPPSSCDFLWTDYLIPSKASPQFTPPFTPITMSPVLRRWQMWARGCWLCSLHFKLRRANDSSPMQMVAERQFFPTLKPIHHRRRTHGYKWSWQQLIVS